ncbi:cytochrome C [Chromatiales bacterium (ex Bugula neritina AB1)]|nr:cytochrome C [Chromatiales bacterium (ex Bugula neritina AB1)]
MKLNKILNPVRSCALVAMCSLAALPISADEAFSPYVSESGDISFPEDFRLSMTHMGSWFVPDGGASGFHDVYTERATVEAFRETGKFPDGATVVKELRAHESGSYTTGQGVSHSTEGLKQWFVMIKDSKGRFADNGVWGDGWGWALFKPDSQGANAAADYKADCLSCHIPAKDNDWIYTEAYPILNK